jgi:hypothetical protein
MLNKNPRKKKEIRRSYEEGIAEEYEYLSFSNSFFLMGDS